MTKFQSSCLKVMQGKMSGHKARHGGQLITKEKKLEYLEVCYVIKWSNYGGCA